MERIDLGEGQWADLRSTATHGEDKALRREYVRGRNDLMWRGEWDTLIARVFVADWSIRDRDGVAIPIERAVDPEYRIELLTRECVERVPAEPMRRIVSRAADIYIEATVPNEPTPPPSGS